MAQQKKSQRHRSAIKAQKQAARRNLRSRSMRKQIRYAAKAALEAATAKDAKLPESLSKAMSVIDRAAKVGVLHRRTAARRKSRLARRLAKQLAAVPAA